VDVNRRKEPVTGSDELELKGARTAPECRFAIVVSRFNEEITEGLLSGARAALADASVSDDRIVLVRVPGAYEIPLAALRLAETGRFDAVICLGCLIKGDTMHFEYIADAVSHGIMEASAASGVPMAFGVLTTMTDEQAELRAAAGPDNKGREAAMAAVEMATLFRRIAEIEEKP
jgi:6,7-dimethyl-8-ribityllumazine synthase